jgi:phosphoglycerol transferase
MNKLLTVSAILSRICAIIVNINFPINMNQTSPITKNLIKLIIYFMGLFLIALSVWTEKFFGSVTMDQALSTIKFGIKGALTADPVFYTRFIKWCLVMPAIATALMMLIEKLTTRLRKCYLVLLVIGLIDAGYQFSVLDYVKQFSSVKTDYFKSNYIDPKQVIFKMHHPKSLVLIYVESLENSYSDKKIFDHDLLQSLHHLNGISFKNYTQMPGTGWTVAGIVSTQCGVPLKSITLFNGNNQGKMFNDFLGHAECLSDILAKNGYINIYMNGSALEFAGIDRFLKTHHYTEMVGRKEWLAKGIKQQEMNPWGLYDDDLFAQAKIKLTKLMQSKQHFNLTLVTIDTHGVTGHLSKTCKKQGYHDFAGIVECTANQLADFIHFVRDKGWLEQLNIVIVGDHLAMKNLVSDKLKLSNNRTIFNLLITNQHLIKNTSVITHFDMLPSILDSLGFQYKGSKLGLGYSGFSRKRPAESADRLVVMSNQINNNSATYNRLWLWR